MAAADAAGVDLERLRRHRAARARSRPATTTGALHAAVDAYVPLHAACAGHVRLAAAAGSAVVELGDLAAFMARVPARV